MLTYLDKIVLFILDEYEAQASETIFHLRKISTGRKSRMIPSLSNLANLSNIMYQISYRKELTGDG